MSWIRSKSNRESLEILDSLSAKCAELGGPVARSLYDKVKARDYLFLVSHELSYDQFEKTDPESIQDAIYSRQILALYQKNEILDLGVNKAQVAMDRFAESESMCLVTNIRILLMSRPDLYKGRTDHDVQHVFSIAARKIQSIIGASPPSLDTMQFAFGPGSNTNVNGRLSNPRAKMSVALTCSSDLIELAGELLAEAPHWAALHATDDTEDSCVVDVTVAPGKLSFVPKNAKTFRSIVVEPLLNGFVQKGIGTYMKECLLRSGVDLYDQTINQRAACKGSTDGKLATIDLSMASDCLSRELVFTLLPPCWVDLLIQCVTRNVTIPKSVDSSEILTDPANEDGAYELQKFSSMGNGFTFELESLIFYALIVGVCTRLRLPTGEVSVYGDDLIVPIEAVELLTKVLLAAGFRVNNSKSYAVGEFRESCGADYLRGFDIRPFYLKTSISERHLYTMHNWFVRRREIELANVVLAECNSCYMLWGPDGYGDGHLVGSYALRRNRAAIRKGWCGGVFDTYALSPKRYKLPMKGDSVLPVYSVYTRSGKDSATDPDVVRGSSGYAKISIYTLSETVFPRNGSVR